MVTTLGPKHVKEYMQLMSNFRRIVRDVFKPFKQYFDYLIDYYSSVEGRKLPVHASISSMTLMLSKQKVNTLGLI